MRSHPADTKVRKEGRGGCAPGAEIPLQTVMETTAEQVYLEGLQPLFKMVFKFAALRIY